MSVIETLHCTACDQDFTRERKRGVKPKTCQDCKAVAIAKAEAVVGADTGADGTLVLARNGMVVLTKGALDLIRRWREWNREDAELFAMYQMGEFSRDEWIELKTAAPVKLAGLPNDQVWKLAAFTGLLDT